MKTTIFTVLGLLVFSSNIFAQSVQPEDLAQQQLDAYNKRDIDAFIAPYSDSVKVYNFPQQLMFTGKHIMKEQYGKMFEQAVDLHCTLVNRMVEGNTVIDQESVVFQKGSPPAKVFAVYKIKDNKIAEVYFIRPD